MSHPLVTYNQEKNTGVGGVVSDELLGLGTGLERRRKILPERGGTTDRGDFLPLEEEGDPTCRVDRRDRRLEPRCLIIGPTKGYRLNVSDYG